MRHSRRSRRGFALESTLLLLVLLGALVAVASAAVAVYTRTSAVDVRASQVEYAAEGGADQIMAQLDAALADGELTLADIAGLTTPVLPGYTFTQRTTVDGSPTTRMISRGAFAGLYAFQQPMTIHVTATATTGGMASVSLGIALQSIPIFQFGAFYEFDLEVTNGPPMTFSGWMHSNKNIYLSSPAADFLNLITAADSVFKVTKDDGVDYGGVRIADASGTLQPLTFDSRTAHGSAFVAAAASTFNNRLMSGESGVRPLRLPLPMGMDPIELIRPARVGDTPDVTAVRMANKADLRIIVDLARPLTSVCTEANFIRTGGRTALGAACPGIFSMARNAFFDGREVRWVDALELDMAALRTWVNGGPGARQVSVLYVEFQNRDAAVATRDYPALRIRNGAELPAPGTPGTPGGLSVVTNAALYVQGDYNTINWKPAALMADVATILSNGWSDATSSVFPRPLTSTPTTINSAMLSGNTETSCDITRCGGPQQFGGGLENLPRLIENWGGDPTGTTGTPLTIVGSFVALFPSSQSGQPWGHSSNLDPSGTPQRYYVPPRRVWTFDTRFRNPLLLPPGTPRLGTVAQVAFRRVY